MGMFDEVEIPCPNCGAIYVAQSKGGDCSLARYNLDNVPMDVADDVTRHAPFRCDECDEVFDVLVRPSIFPVRVR